MSKNPVEILFLVEESKNGEFSAQAVGYSIYTEAASLEELKKNVLEALECHFVDSSQIPAIVRLHIVKDEILFYAKTAA